MNTWVMCAVLLAMGLSGCGEGGERAVAPVLDDEPLALEFFAAGNMWMMFASSEPMTARDLKELQSTLNGVSAATEKAKGDTDDEPFYALLPPLMFGARHLFEGGSFSEDDKELAVALSEVIAADFGASDLRIDSESDVDIIEGVQRIKHWFQRLCDDDEKLGAMIATLDDGPFFGEAIANESLEGWEALGDVELPGDAGVVLLRFMPVEGEGTSQANGGRLVLQHKDASGDTTWTHRLTADSPDDIVGTPAGLSDTPAAHFPGFGYVFGGFASWTFGTERMTVFLKEDATPRFYFLSW